MKTHGALLIVALLGSRATAEVRLAPTCGVIDLTRDHLAPAERGTASELLARALERAELLVVTTGCEDTFSLFHVRSGELIEIHLEGPRGIVRTLRIPKLRTAQLAAYEQLVRGVVDERAAPPRVATAPASAEDDPVTTRSVTAPADEPTVAPRTRPSALLYGELGMGMVGNASGGAFGFGLRHTVADHTALDLGFDGGGSDGTANRFGFHARAVWFHPPDARYPLYGGGGMSVSKVSTPVDSNTGFSFDAVGGIELTTKMFIQSELALPVYTVGSMWPVTLTLSIGSGFDIGG